MVPLTPGLHRLGLQECVCRADCYRDAFEWQPNRGFEDDFQRCNKLCGHFRADEGLDVYSQEIWLQICAWTLHLAPCRMRCSFNWIIRLLNSKYRDHQKSSRKKLTFEHAVITSISETLHTSCCRQNTFYNEQHTPYSSHQHNTKDAAISEPISAFAPASQSL